MRDRLIEFKLCGPKEGVLMHGVTHSNAVLVLELLRRGYGIATIRDIKYRFKFANGEGLVRERFSVDAKQGATALDNQDLRSCG